MFDKKSYMKEYHRKWYKKNRSRILEQTRLWFVNNRKRKSEVVEALRVKKLLSWIVYFPIETNCEVCSRPLLFRSPTRAKRIHFDHKSSECIIKGSPSVWLRNNFFNEENKNIWESCDFGILCNRCNRYLPTIGRKEFVDQLYNYVHK